MMPTTPRLPFIILSLCAAITAITSIAAGPRPLSVQDEGEAMTFTLDPVHCMANFCSQIRCASDYSPPAGSRLGVALPSSCFDIRRT